MSGRFPHLGLAGQDIPSFAAAVASYLPAEFTEGNALENAVGKSLGSLDELASPEICRKRAARFGVSEHLVKEKARSLGKGKPLIVGLRFRKLNAEFPFAHVTPGFPVTEEDLARLRREVPGWFSGLGLRGFTLRAGPACLPAGSHEKWSHAVFGLTSGVPLLELPGHLHVRWEADTSFFPFYAREYAGFLRQNPDKNAFLHAEDRETLEEAAKAGLLLSVYDAEGWAGAIAGTPKNFYGLDCLYIFEIFLAERLRGKKLAASLEALFLRGLASRFERVYGHISDANPASLRTALSVGRRVIESELFLPL